MPSVKLSPVLNDTQFSSNNTLLSGGKIYWYIAGTSTPVSTYTDSGGVTSQAWPIILNTRGEVDNEIWLQTGQTYKAVLNDSLDNFVRQFDDISGINDTTVAVISEWVTFGGAPTYISANSFSVIGDLTTTFTLQRRVKATVSAGDYYGTISNSVFGAGITTVTLANDVGKAIDTGISQVFYGFLDPSHPSIDLSGINSASQSAAQTQLFTAFTSGGVAGTFTLTPSPAISSYLANQRFNVKFNVSGNGSDTINVSGLGAKSLKQYDSGGTKVAPVIVANQLADIEYDGTDFIILDALTPANAIDGSKAARSNLQLSATGTNASVNITFDSLTLRRTSKGYNSLQNGSLTLNTAIVGDGGLDTGVLAANTWYYIWVIALNNNIATGSIICSLSSTAPTMPGTYLLKARIGAFRTDGTANKYPLSFIQYDNYVQYKPVAGSNLTAIPLITSGIAGTIGTTLVSSSVSTVVPATSARIKVSAYNGTAGVQVSPDSVATGSGSAGIFCNLTTQAMTMQGDFALESTNVWYASNAAGAELRCAGWVDNI